MVYALAGVGMSVELKITDDFPPATKDDWRARVEEDLGSGSVDKLVARTIEGLDIDPLYAREDGAEPDARGFPGLPPFVRGGDAVERATRGWLVCQEHAHPGVEATSRALARDLERGADAVRLRLGLAHGTRVLTVGDLARLLEPLDPGERVVYLDAGPDTLPVAAAYVGHANNRGTDPGSLRGGFGCDPLGTLAREGTLASGLEGAFREMADLLCWSRDRAPNMKALSCSTLPYHQAGATAVQELAWGIGTAAEYLRRMVAAGLPVDEPARRMIFEIGVGGDFFMQVAKLRAARWLWSKVVCAWGGDEAAQALVIHARTSPWTKTRRDPWVNMLRATAESFAAAVGGADGITTSAFDEAIGPSDDFARRVARNTQLVLREEAHLHRVLDPAGGSWYLESLTERLARAAWEELRAVEERGGMARLLMRGKVHSALERVQGQRREDIATRRVPLVGVSEFPNLEEPEVERSYVPGPDESPIGRGLREGDDDARRERLQALADLTTGRREPGPGEITGATIEAAAEGVDLFSLGAVLRWGRASRHIEPIRPWRAAEPWETLRDASDKFLQRHGRRPRVFLANLGPIPEHRARAEYAHNLFAAGGVEPVTNDGFESPEKAAEAFAESGAEVAVICGPDARYPDAVPDLAARLKDRGASAVVVAGRPGEHEDDWRKAGVDRFVFVGADVLGVLKELHRELGVTS